MFHHALVLVLVLVVQNVLSVSLNMFSKRQNYISLKHFSKTKEQNKNNEQMNEMNKRTKKGDNKLKIAINASVKNLFH